MLSRFFLKKETTKIWSYLRHFLDATLTFNLRLWNLKKIFSLQMVRSDICLGSSSKQNALFSKYLDPENSTEWCNNENLGFIQVMTNNCFLSFGNFVLSLFMFDTAQFTFICLKWTMEIPVKSVKYVKFVQI